MSCCWDCQTTSCSCTTPIYWVCWLESWDCIDVVETTQVWECCKTYQINSTIDITSDDGSIEVVKTDCTYDLSVVPNTDLDRLVAVNWLDTPWFLVDKVKDCGNWVVTVTPRQISPSNWILEICWMPSAWIPAPVAVDERVRFKSGCTPDFLSSQLTEWDCISIDKTWCEAIFSIKDCCFTKPEWRITVTTDYEVNIAYNAPSSLREFAIADTNTVASTNGWPGISTTVLALPWGNVNWLTLTEAWIYRVSYNWLNWISNWVSGWFASIYATTFPNAILEIWYIGASWYSLTPYNPNDALTTMNPADLETRQFSWSIDIALPANTTLYIWWQVQPLVTVGNGTWNRWCILVKTKSTLSVERISDNTWIFRHTTC